MQQNLMPRAATMTTREIADLTGKEHRNVLRDARNMLAELYGEGGVLNFEQTLSNPQNGQLYPVFALPKRETLILVSGYSIPMRARIIDRWQELEAQATQPAVPQSLPEALRLAADLAEQKAVAEAALAVAAPKAAALDRIATSEAGAVNLRLAAKLAQVPERQFIALLEAHCWIFRTHQNSYWQGYHDKEAAGLVEMKCVTYRRPDDTESTTYQVRITPKGMTKLAELIERKAPHLRKAARPAAHQPGLH